MPVLRKLGRFAASQCNFSSKSFHSLNNNGILYSNNQTLIQKNDKSAYNLVRKASLSTSFLSSCSHRNNEINKNNSAASSLAQEVLASKINKEALKDDSTQTMPKFSTKEEEKQWKEDQEKNRENAENQKRALRFSFLFMGSVIVLSIGSMVYVWGVPDYDAEGNEIKDEFSDLSTIKRYIKRTVKGMKILKSSVVEPSRDVLLPDPLSGNYIQPPYTLVLELKDVLVHPEWSYSNGWRFKKRPGLDYLLQHCIKHFEIVVYTQEAGMTANHIVEQMDPQKFIMYRLFKDSTRYVDGKHIKEIGKLNRDMKKVIMVDWDADAISSPRNQLKVKRWDGDMNDQGLIYLAELVRTISDNGVDDVRSVLDYYKKHEDPLEAFEQFQKQTKQNDLQKLEKKEHEKNPRISTSWKPSFMKR